MKTKNILRSAVIFIILAFLFTGSVSAAMHTAGADDLKSLGLFLGTDNGYELDREPTRAEAAVMLVRLLGKEVEAKDKNFAHPFTDVPDWASPYVGYLYEKKLTNGIGGNKFGSIDLCDANMFCTFILRALGYTETAGDFTYDGAVDFAVKFGLVTDDTFSNSDFTRDYCVSIMYDALNIKIKGTNTTLIEKLVNDKAVDEKAAEKLIAKNALVDELNKLLEKAITVDMKDAYSMDSEVIEIDNGNTVKTNGSISVIGDSYAADITVDNGNGNIEKTSEYLKDGYLYINSTEKKEKREAANYSASNMRELPTFSQGEFENMPAALTNNIEKSVTDKNINYTIKIVTESGVSYNNVNGIDEVVISITLNLQGELDSINYHGKESYGDKVRYENYSNIKITGIGDSVKINFPDFSDYRENLKLSMIYEFDDSYIPTNEEMKSVIDTVKNRLYFSVVIGRINVTQKGNNQILIEVPDISDYDTLNINFKEEIRDAITSNLEFRDSDKNVIIEGTDIANATSGYGNTGKGYDEYYVKLELKPEAIKKFSEAAKKTSGSSNYIAIRTYLGDVWWMFGGDEQKIDTDSLILTGNYSKYEVEDMLKMIMAWKSSLSLHEVSAEIK